MFDFDAGKLIVIGIVALIVIGPKELPRVMRQVGQAAAKMRRMAAEFRGQFMDAMREADLEDFKADAAKLADTAKMAVGVDRLADIKAGITSALEAADKPASLPLAETPAIAAPGSSGASLNSIALPRLPEAPEGSGETFLAEGIAPVVPEAGSGSVSASKAPPATTEAEMKALADALKAEMGETAPPRPAADAAKTRDNAGLVRPFGFGYIKSMFRKS
ncbi:MAG TPA: twin-arginine translocase TatA/TatE family subunit [Methylocella sp.]|nr:twin-arginine translocase TatA/TatE family subunit [Methylocella sp.]